MRRRKASEVPVEYLMERAAASTIATLRRAQAAHRRIEEARRLLALHQAPRSIADLFAQPGSASAQRSLQGASRQQDGQR
jgi:hypothetical protein